MTVAQLDAHRSRLRSAGLEPVALAPGLSARAVTAALAAAGLPAIQPLVDLYGFADGAVGPGEDHRGLFFEPAFRSLARAIAGRTDDLSLLESDHEDPPYLASYLPVFATDPTLVIDTADPAGAVVRVWWDSPSEVAYPSIAAFVEAQTQALDEGELQVIDARLQPAPLAEEPPAKPIATVSYVLGNAEPTRATVTIVGMLPDVFCDSGADAFRVVAHRQGAIAGNDDREPDQLANFRSLIEGTPGLRAFSIVWDLHPRTTPLTGSRHIIEIYAGETG